MVSVHPFRGIRPIEELASKVAVLPYDVIDSQEAREDAAGNPYSYYHIDRSEIDLSPSLSPYDPAVYLKAAKNFEHFQKNGWLIEEEQPVFYLYQLTMDGRSQTGIVATTAIQEYLDGKIKKHEFTRPEKEQDRINHIRACDADTSPIFLSYRKQEGIQKVIKEWQEMHQPAIDFVSYYDVRHQVWKITDGSIQTYLVDAFKAVGCLYIADGHHRTESAVKVGLEKRAQGIATDESERFLSILFPDDELAIYEYNRVINEHVPVDFFEQLEKVATIEKVAHEKPRSRGEIMIYVSKQWYRLILKEELKIEDPVEGLDVSFLQNYIIAPIFGITDVRTDKRIDFVGGIRGSDELVKKVDSGKWQVAFELYPTQMSDLLKVADAGKIMPPKSTWFEPKLLSGLFLYSLKTNRGHD